VINIELSITQKRYVFVKCDMETGKYGNMEIKSTRIFNEKLQEYVITTDCPHKENEGGILLGYSPIKKAGGWACLICPHFKDMKNYEFSNNKSKESRIVICNKET